MFKVVTICGSFRFTDDMLMKKKELEREHDIVLMPNMYFSKEEIAEMDEWHIQILHEVHNRKMKISDYIFVVNPGGYIGKDTKREIDWAMEHNIPVEYMEEVDETNKHEDLTHVSNKDLVHEVERRVAEGIIDLDVTMNFK